MLHIGLRKGQDYIKASDLDIYDKSDGAFSDPKRSPKQTGAPLSPGRFGLGSQEAQVSPYISANHV